MLHHAHVGAFAIRCWHCRLAFDGWRATWCSCVAKQATLACTHCLRCFCDAPRGYIDAVWAAAPHDFFRERRAPKPLPDNPDAEHAIHPFVLVVDDDRNDVETAVNVISSLGYGVAYARDGREALQAAAMYRPDLVLTDELIPGVEGKLAVELKSARIPPKVVIMSVMDYEPGTGFAAMDDFLRKPLSAPRLRRVLQRAALGKDVQ